MSKLTNRKQLIVSISPAQRAAIAELCVKTELNKSALTRYALEILAAHNGIEWPDDVHHGGRRPYPPDERDS